MAQISRLGRRKLADILLEEGVVKEDQLREVNLKIRVTGESLIDALHGLGFVTETEVARAVAKQFGLPFIDPTRYRIPREAVDALPGPFLRLNQMVVLDKIGRTLLLAVSGALSAEVLEKVERATGCQIFVFASLLSKVFAALDKAAGVPAPGAKK